MDIKFMLPSIVNEKDAKEYIDEFKEYKSAINGTGGLDGCEYDLWLKKVTKSHLGEVSRKDRVPASTYFVFNESNKIIGMVNIRHCLNDYLITSGSGHIGYSVRPTERRKGYATQILAKALQFLKNDYGVSEALVGCYKENIGSKRTILKNGGKLHKEILEDDGRITLAYKITINE